MSHRLPPFRYYLYALSTVNVVMALVLFLTSLVFSGGVNVVAMAVVLLVVNVVTVYSVRHNA